jgi:hypothetical protein
MRDRGDKTRFGYPPEGNSFEPFPQAVPWDKSISELTNWWLAVDCCRGTVRMPLRLMAAERGWQLTLREVVRHLRCSQCGQRPKTVAFEPRSSNDRDAQRHLLVVESVPTRDGVPGVTGFP